MALFQAQLGAAATTVFDPAAESAVTTLFLCNTHSATVTVTLYLITGTGAPDDGNAIWKDTVSYTHLTLPTTPYV